MRESPATFDSDLRIIRQTTPGVTLANAYHPEMMGVLCRERYSPLSLFHDDDKLKMGIRRFLKYGGIFSDQGIRMVTTMERRSQAVGNFRPTAARAIFSYIQGKKSPPNTPPEDLEPINLMVDFCAGWGGRMLGALSAGVPYVGIDPNTVSLAANRKMAEDVCREFKLPVPELVCACAEDVLGQRRWRPDLIFTSPPYFNVEKYSDEETQSYKRHPTLEQWYEGFLGACIRGAHYDLVDGGFLALNVNPDMETETKRLGLESGFTYLETIGMLISKRQYKYDPTKTGGTRRTEPVLIFQKA